MNEDNITILFISDLHISEYGNNVLEKEKYINSFFDSFETTFGEYKKIDILVIAGDLVDKGGSDKAYEKAVSIINNIMKKLNITDLLVIPGNHDVNRVYLKSLISDPSYDCKKLYSYNKEKFTTFSKWTSNLKIMDIEKSIVSEALINDKVLLLGINSLDRIGDIDGIGYIEDDKLSEELKVINDKYKSFDRLIKVMILHHNPNYYGSNLENISANNSPGAATIGTFDRNNWDKIKKILLHYNISIVLSGHVHGSQVMRISDCESDNDIYYSTVGSIGMDFNKELIEYLNFVDEAKMVQEIGSDRFNKYKQFENWVKTFDSNLSISNHHNTYSLININCMSGIWKEQHYKHIKDEGVDKWIGWYEPEKTHTFKNCTDESNPFASSKNIIANGGVENISIEISKKIIEIIRNNQLYKTGHFHWGQQCTLNWIDTTIFLSKAIYMNYVIESIVKMYNTLLKNSDYIIGYGIKGAILMSGIRYNYSENRFSYYPDSDSNDFEKKMKDFINIKKLVILTDVIHSGDSIREALNSISDSLAENVHVDIVAIIDSSNNALEESVVIGNKELLITYNSLVKLKVIDCNKHKSGVCEVRDNNLDIVYEM